MQQRFRDAPRLALAGLGLGLGLILAAAPIPAMACATCGCSLSTDAAMGYSAAAGWRLSLQYDDINQSQLRSGTGSVSPASVAAINDAGGNQEVEHDTINRTTTLGLSYSPSADWNFSLLVPYIDRSHTTYGAASNPLTPDQLSGATVTGLGDVKFITAWQGLLPTHNLGLQLGVKLPTGHYGGPDAAGTGTVGHEPVTFSRGPAAGQLLDTSLQAGTGSTDLIVGAYFYQAVSQNFDAFVNGQFQAAVMHKLDQPGQDYRPGNLATVSFGVRYEKNPDVVPQLQVNLSHKSADQGALADTADTAGTVAYLSPGLSMSLTKGMQLYGFIQLPVYSKLEGYQLFPHWTATAGMSYAF
ncbi:MAG: transporter [Betaproteobacteria bacterium]|nr:transporter [Betaproteobacteria bacterium]MDE2123731.1 transporter [Betaproteobacteria bacterium]MDE2185197.1 transporter [Betaproteobacteria bacterium]MDE2324753.1 transporter [Betaproteobacteria bacterium]